MFVSQQDRIRNILETFVSGLFGSLSRVIDASLPHCRAHITFKSSILSPITKGVYEPFESGDE